MCLQTKVLASLQVILNFFFLLFQKKRVGRAMGNETFYGDGLSEYFMFYGDVQTRLKTRGMHGSLLRADP